MTEKDEPRHTTPVKQGEKKAFSQVSASRQICQWSIKSLIRYIQKLVTSKANRFRTWCKV